MGRGRLFRSGGVGRVWLSLALLRRGCTLGSVWSLVWSSWTWFPSGRLLSTTSWKCCYCCWCCCCSSLPVCSPTSDCLPVCLSFSSLLALAVAIQHPSRSFPVTLATSQGSSAPGETPGREREKERERERNRVESCPPQPTEPHSLSPYHHDSHSLTRPPPYTINTAVVTTGLAVRPSNLQHGH